MLSAAQSGKPDARGLCLLVHAWLPSHPSVLAGTHPCLLLRRLVATLRPMGGCSRFMLPSAGQRGRAVDVWQQHAWVHPKCHHNQNQKFAPRACDPLVHSGQDRRHLCFIQQGLLTDRWINVCIQDVSALQPRAGMRSFCERYAFRGMQQIGPTSWRACQQLCCIQ